MSTLVSIPGHFHGKGSSHRGNRLRLNVALTAQVQSNPCNSSRPSSSSTCHAERERVRDDVQPARAMPLHVGGLEGDRASCGRWRWATACGHTNRSNSLCRCTRPAVRSSVGSRCGYSRSCNFTPPPTRLRSEATPEPAIAAPPTGNASKSSAQFARRIPIGNLWYRRPATRRHDSSLSDLYSAAVTAEHRSARRSETTRTWDSGETGIRELGAVPL